MAERNRTRGRLAASLLATSARAVGSSGIGILAWVAVFGFAVAAVAADAIPAGKGDGIWVGGTSPQLKVKVDSHRHGVEVTMSKARGKVPRSIGVSFFDGKGSQTTLELKAVEPIVSAPNEAIQYRGALEPSAQSFVGFEIRIPLRPETPTVVRSDDLKKVE